MTVQNRTKLNQLQEFLPEGLLVDATWLAAKGYSTSLRSQYVAAGWLSQPVRRVYQRGRGELRWEQAVVSLQTLLRRRLVVGGRTALELQGYGHYLAQAEGEVFLYGPEAPPTWLAQLPVPEKFSYRNSEVMLPVEGFAAGTVQGGGAKLPNELMALPSGQWGWPLVVSSPERALLELLDEVPGRETFGQADALVEGLANLRPRLLEKLLRRCRSVKVKRLFFFFATRHQHGWLGRVGLGGIDLGSGKRLLERGGVLDRRYQITVPEELSGVF